jgi:hypothetical protein
MIGAIIQTVEKVIFIVIPVTPFAFVLVQTKTFLVVSFCNKQLFEVRNAVKFAIIRCVRFHPEEQKIHISSTHNLRSSSDLYVKKSIFLVQNLWDSMDAKIIIKWLKQETKWSVSSYYSITKMTTKLL